jgi:hypothetical protein
LALSRSQSLIELNSIKPRTAFFIPGKWGVARRHPRKAIR